MNKALIIGLIGVLARTLSAAESSPQDKIIDAAKRLGDQPNYSWTTTIKEADGSPGWIGLIAGKADKSGLTYLSFEIFGTPFEVYMKGKKGIINAWWEDWGPFDWVDKYGSSHVVAAVIRYLRSYKAPGVESADLSGRVKNVKEAAGAFSGELEEDAAKEFLESGVRHRRVGQEPPKTANPRGSVKFWIQDGALTKYEINVQGKVIAGNRETDVNRTTTIEIKDVGTTRLHPPDKAKPGLL